MFFRRHPSICASILQVFRLMLYNMGSGILRAVGDSRRPLYILMICALGNIFFDLLFVIVFHAGVEGVAYATILSQWISAILVLVILTREKSSYRLIWKDLHIHKGTAMSIFRIGFPAGLQIAVHFFFQCICSVLYQPFRLLLHGWLDNLWKTG